MVFTTNEKVSTGGALVHTPLVANDARHRCTIRWLIAFQIFSIIIILALAVSFCSFAYVDDHRKTDQNNGKTNDVCQKKVNLTTLYAYDSLSSTFCFNDGQYGTDIIDWRLYNRASDIDFNNYHKNSFSVGIEGGRLGTIVDLGTAEDLRRKYQYRETVGNGQQFASIHRQNRTLLIVKTFASLRDFQIMNESVQLFQEGAISATAPVQLGHIYVLRITDRFDSTFERIVKMIVTAYRPDESVTIRWVQLA